MGHLHPIFHTGSPSAGRLVLGLADHPALDLAAADLASLAQARWEVHGGGVWKTMDWVGKSTGNQRFSHIMGFSCQFSNMGVDSEFTFGNFG